MRLTCLFNQRGSKMAGTGSKDKPEKKTGDTTEKTSKSKSKKRKK